MPNLSNYPPGVSGRIEQREGVPHECPGCKQTKDIPMFYELGGWFYEPDHEEEVFCVKCETEMVPKEGA